ncbi:MAG TPA: OB-fold nucleic acid binding domain-containing protein [Candidatus Nanoarchaeia archaeon]|nr:OB-fold nucleic acid binding domain-containing protein [Candidatus Nanoarchaeia archaeon]
MDERILLIASVACSLVGIAVLFIFSGSVAAEESSISKITGGVIDGTVAASGRVVKIRDSGKVSVIDIESEDTVSVVMFKEGNEHILLSKGDRVQVRGRAGIEEGKAQIIADEVRVVG